MFLQYTFPGAFLQLYSIHLQNLRFTPVQVSICCATQALASVLVTLLAGQAADRWVSAERIIAFCSLVCGVICWILPWLDNVWIVFAATLLFWMLANPVMLLGTSLCFAHLKDPEREFGAIRLWGTIGWMVPCWILLIATLLGWPKPTISRNGSTDLFRVGSLFAFTLGFYAWSLPHTPPRPDAPQKDAPLAALRLVGSRSFFVYCACTAGLCITWPFSTQATPLLLHYLGMPVQWISPTMTLGQVMEVASLAVLPAPLFRLGIRGTMLLGLGSWMVALVLLTIGEPLWMAVSSLLLNGICVSGFLVTGQVFVNRKATGDLRASVQSLLTFVNGAGQLLGHLLIGLVRWVHNGQLPQAFGIAAAIMSAMFLLFLVGFREEEPVPRPEPAM